jgi:hypothetical protein
MSDIGDIFTAYRLSKQAEGQERRAAADETFADAQALASPFGLVLARHSAVHYTLSLPGGWWLNVYPGNRRLFWDRNRPRPPYLRLPLEWTLLDVVQAAIREMEVTR